jgi:hypothetical protein
VNLYVVVEGRTEKAVYSKWIPLINPSLTEIGAVADVKTNSFLIVEGGGVPAYFDVIKAGVEDVHSITAFNRLVVCIDSEELTYTAKYQEVESFIDGIGLPIDYRIVVQHFCFETWALGNQKIVSRHPKDPRLLGFKNHFDVGVQDPELLTIMPGSILNRALFAESYLRALMHEKYRNLSYVNGHPGPVAHGSYYAQLVTRQSKTGHIRSFSHLLSAMI